MEVLNMKRAVLALTALAAILALGGLAGCQKKTLAETGGADLIKSSLKKDPTVVPEALNKEAEAATTLLEPPHEALAALHDAFMKQGSKLGYKYVAAEDSLAGDKLPGGKMMISSLITQYYQIHGEAGDVLDPVYRATTIEGYLKNPAFPVAELVATPEELQAEQKALAAQQSGAPWQEALSVALDPYGDWQSYEEVREGQNKNDNVVKHDDKYYKNLFIQANADPSAIFNGKANLQEYRDAKLENKYEQPFNFNKETGELTMFSDEGSPLLVLVLKQMAGEKDILYVKNQYDFVYTVYERIGSGGRSASKSEREKEKREFEAQGGSTVHGGKEGGKKAPEAGK